MIISDPWSYRGHRAIAIGAGQPPAITPAPSPATAVTAAAPVNAGNLILDHEAALYRRAIRAPKTLPAGTALPEPSHQPFAIAGLGDHTIIAASGGYRIAIYQGIIYNGGDEETIRLLDLDQDLMGALTLLGGGVGLLLPWSDHPYFVLQPGHPFVINISSISGVSSVTGFLKFRMLENYPN